MSNQDFKQLLKSASPRPWWVDCQEMTGTYWLMSEDDKALAPMESAQPDAINGEVITRLANAAEDIDELVDYIMENDMGDGDCAHDLATKIRRVLDGEE